jgi:diguanylate cyclase (GGDEF)-like protein/PAS domain S-box-containing protein
MLIGGEHVAPKPTSLDGRRADSAANHSSMDASVLIGPLAASLQQLYEAIPVALGVIGRDGRYLAANAAYAAIHNATPGTIVGRALADYLPGAGAQLQEDFCRFETGIGSIEREVSCHGSHYLAALQPVRDEQGDVQGVTSVLIDITARKHMEQALEKARRHWQFHASHDHLTGLPNRRQLDEVITTEASRSQRSGSPLSMLMMDVDYFKRYNDCIGHQGGDECLRAIAAALQTRMQRHGDVVGRYGGEEFIAILPGTDRAGAYHVAQGVLEEIRALAIGHPSSPYSRVTLSIGVATLEDAGGHVAERCDTLLDYADRALYAAKAAGRNTVCIHPPCP